MRFHSQQEVCMSEIFSNSLFMSNGVLAVESVQNDGVHATNPYLDTCLQIYSAADSATSSATKLTPTETNLIVEISDAPALPKALACPDSDPAPPPR